MSIQHVNTISNRLSLRAPQRESLEILDRICEIATLEKGADTQVLLSVIQSEFKHVKSFDRDFLSICFALATGVGKTRLMGAFISYLYQTQNIRHFFVLAPNLTIYNKLIADFTPNTPKYVFKGIGDFAQNSPLIVTGDNYESGIGVKEGSLFDEEVKINIFNISKITAKDNGHFADDDAKKALPRFRRLREEMGESYFDYLAGLDDLVVIMDESHRYRAHAGMSAINELKPILGLELTATPQVEKGKGSVPFTNVIYSYPLSSAMNDGFVKEPAVATRENFDASNYTDAGLEKVKLEDGVHIHEDTKVELAIYAKDYNQILVKPFMMVVAQDTTHANDLQVLMESEDFFDGRYRGKIITIHSKSTKGSEGDDIVQQLLTVEDPANPVEIVIHVNMLKEGWDVTNLYTIVPLRAANSRTLVEQSIGRGLRLPYGRRVGVPAVDRLTIVSHDRFQDIIDHANDPNSIIRTGVVIGRDISLKGKKAIEANSSITNFINARTTTEATGTTCTYPGSTSADSFKIFEKPEASAVAKATLVAISKYEDLSSSQGLTKPEIAQKIAAQVKEEVTQQQGTLDFGDKVDVDEIVEKTIELYREMSIDIPKIVVIPKGEVVCGYEDFDLDINNINLQPVDQDILLQNLRDRQRQKIAGGSALVEESRPEDYIVRGLIDYDDICYDDHSAVLYKLAGQLVGHLSSYLSGDDVLNVLQAHQQALVRLVHTQMQEHFFESATEYEAIVTKGFKTLTNNNFTTGADENIRDFRIALQEGERNQIKSMVFGGFHKCLYNEQKFDSDSERRFAIILENDSSVIKWFKPSRNDFQIHYNSKDSYEPDFVVETKNGKFLCEPKRASEMTDEIVLAKAKAAAIWCKNASVHAEETDKKPWRYLLIPHDQIKEQMTLSGLAASFTI